MWLAAVGITGKSLETTAWPEPPAAASHDARSPVTGVGPLTGLAGASLGNIGGGGSSYSIARMRPEGPLSAPVPVYFSALARNPPARAVLSCKESPPIAIMLPTFLTSGGGRRGLLPDSGGSQPGLARAPVEGLTDG